MLFEAHGVDDGNFSTCVIDEFVILERLQHHRRSTSAERQADCRVNLSARSTSPGQHRSTSDPAPAAALFDIMEPVAGGRLAHLRIVRVTVEIDELLEHRSFFVQAFEDFAFHAQRTAADLHEHSGLRSRDALGKGGSGTRLPDQSFRFRSSRRFPSIEQRKAPADWKINKWKRHVRLTDNLIYGQRRTDKFRREQCIFFARQFSKKPVIRLRN